MVQINSTLRAYSNKQTVKDFYLDRMRQHIAADELVRGGGTWDGSSGCAVGCLMHDYNHAKAITEPIHFPEWLMRLIDTLHENSSSLEFSASFNLRLLNAVPVGFTDFEQIKNQFIAFILRENIERVEALDISEEIKNKVIEANRQCLEYAESENKTEEMRSAAESAAWSAARSAAWSAAWSAAESAAESAARSAAESAAESAARSAAWSAAWSAAESAAYDRYANYLIDLFDSQSK